MLPRMRGIRSARSCTIEIGARADRFPICRWGSAEVGPRSFGVLGLVSPLPRVPQNVTWQLRGGSQRSAHLGHIL